MAHDNAAAIGLYEKLGFQRVPVLAGQAEERDQRTVVHPFFIEANERPGLANHEPQPTAKAFVDYLFPGSPAVPQAWTPTEASNAEAP